MAVLMDETLGRGGWDGDIFYLWVCHALPGKQQPMGFICGDSCPCVVQSVGMDSYWLEVVRYSYT